MWFIVPGLGFFYYLLKMIKILLYSLPQVNIVQFIFCRLKLKVENTIRWRDNFDKEGNVVKESNARFIRWSDGSMSLHLGCEIFDVHKQPLQVWCSIDLVTFALLLDVPIHWIFYLVFKFIYMSRNHTLLVSFIMIPLCSLFMRVY